MDKVFSEKWLQIRAAFAADDALDELLFNGLHVIGCKQQLVAEFPQFFADAESYFDFLYELAINSNVRLDTLHPFAGGLYGDGNFRWQIILPPAAAELPLLSVRRLRLFQIRTSDFVDGLAFADFCKHEQARSLPVICAGVTGSGKTTLGCAVAIELAPQQRLIVLERIPEIAGAPPTWLLLRGRSANAEGSGALPLTTLFEESLRLRPDGYIIGEIRNRDDCDVFTQAARTGHALTLATLHAGSITEAVDRIRALQEPSRPPLKAIVGIVERRSVSRVREWGIVTI